MSNSIKQIIDNAVAANNATYYRTALLDRIADAVVAGIDERVQNAVDEATRLGYGEDAREILVSVGLIDPAQAPEQVTEEEDLSTIEGLADAFRRFKAQVTEFFSHA